MLPASKCPTKSDKFGNNLQLSWDRAKNFAEDSLSKLNKNITIVQAVYANGTLQNKKSVDVYKVKKS